MRQISSPFGLLDIRVCPDYEIDGPYRIDRARMTLWLGHDGTGESLLNALAQFHDDHPVNECQRSVAAAVPVVPLPLFGLSERDAILPGPRVVVLPGAPRVNPFFEDALADDRTEDAELQTPQSGRPPAAD